MSSFGDYDDEMILPGASSPGPGAYRIPTTMAGPAFTFRGGSSKNGATGTGQGLVPGPGQYFVSPQRSKIGGALGVASRDENVIMSKAPGPKYVIPNSIGSQMHKMKFGTATQRPPPKARSQLTPGFEYDIKSTIGASQTALGQSARNIPHAYGARGQPTSRSCPAYTFGTSRPTTSPSYGNVKGVGPGSYDVVGVMKALSGSPIHSIPVAERTGLNGVERSQTPGPGSYNLSSTRLNVPGGAFGGGRPRNKRWRPKKPMRSPIQTSRWRRKRGVVPF